ncbi:MAG: sodium ion-translocating decarboxylase subunit beta [Syntrophales bacterium]|nr:sodium ion-translocating decarboxylase subunit beta [Syntrophales bacterium]
MDVIGKIFSDSGLMALTWQNITMFIVAGILMYLAIAKNYEPLLLLPIGFGALVANIPNAMMASFDNWVAAGPEVVAPLMQLVYNAGIKTEFLPPVIFLGVGALTDFRPLLSRPITFVLGGAAQFGVMIAAVGAAYLFGFTPQESASIGIIGGADGPTSIYLTAKMAPHLMGAIAVASYSYMSLVPVIQPPVLRLLTTKKERAIQMKTAKPVSRTTVLLFPVISTLMTALLIPSVAPLIGMLMFGNLIRESGVTDRLSNTASTHLINAVTIFLALAVGSTMEGTNFLKSQTLFILVLGCIAFVCSTAGGILFAKLLNLVLPERMKINPCIGAAGVSAVPMAARVVQRFVSEQTKGKVNPLMAAMGPNVAGTIGTAIAAGVFLALLK